MSNGTVAESIAEAMKKNSKSKSNTFYQVLVNNRTESTKKLSEVSELVASALDAKDFRKLYNILCECFSIDSLSDFIKNGPPVILSLEDELAKITQEYPSFVIDTYDTGSIIFTVDFSLQHINKEKGIYWKLNFPKFKVCVSLQYTDINNFDIVVTKASSYQIHPYLNQIGLRLHNNSHSLYDIVCLVINSLSTFKQDRLVYPISKFIGQRCAISGAYTYGQEVKCAVSGEFIHRELAVKIGDAFYSPNIIKTCSKCGKQSHQWINDAGSIICGECNG